MGTTSTRQDRYMEALLDGDKDAAAKIRSEIRAEERKQCTQQTSMTAKQVAEEEQQPA